METLKWLETAIASEKKALHNYLDYAHLTQDKAGKDMFVKLARDEFQHMIILEQQSNRVRTGHLWQNTKMPSSAIEQIIPLLDKKERINSEIALNNETQILSLALKSEKKAMDFYLDKSEKVDSPVVRKILHRLADMENAHYQILQAELDNINKTGFWMGFSETSMEIE